MKKIIIRIVLIIFILCWMHIVFGFSASNGKSSSSLSKRIASIFTKNPDTVQILEPFIRKIAHLSEYAVRRIFNIWIFIYF